MKIETRFIHGGLEPDPTTGAIMTPVYQTSTYVQERVGVHKGYEYSRTLNPTRDALEKNLAAIENGKFGAAFSSGVAAIDAVLKLLNPGDEVIATSDIYGGSYRIFIQQFEKYGIRFHFVDMTNINNIQQRITAKTKLVWVETPTNPLMRIIDIEAVAALTKSKQILLAVDNTFATPYHQNPLDLGADIVMHSVTKYLGGHSDLLMGGLIVNDESLAKQIYAIQNNCGAVPGPQDCFLALRGIKTLHVRMQRHSENAEILAHFLKEHKKVDQVYWAGFEDQPGYAIAKKQMRGFGGMLSFSLKSGDENEAHQVLTNFNVFTLAESLGGIESLVAHPPATMTHAAIPKAERLKLGIVDSLIRLSVGIENVADLKYDLEQALE